MKSVKDYGAKGDGQTDDTASIVRALKECRFLYFPAGRYLTTARIVLPPDTRIMGAGHNVTFIFSNSAHSFFIGTDNDGRA